jgi:hypothetical protein
MLLGQIRNADQKLVFFGIPESTTVNSAVKKWWKLELQEPKSSAGP